MKDTLLNAAHTAAKLHRETLVLAGGFYRGREAFSALKDMLATIDPLASANMCTGKFRLANGSTIRVLENKKERLQGLYFTDVIHV